MGRGKKKDKKNEGNPSLEGLSISDAPVEPQASSSSQPVTEPVPAKPETAKADEEEDFGLGLTGGGGKKRPRKKKGAAAPQTSSTGPAPIENPQHALSPEGDGKGEPWGRPGVQAGVSQPPMHQGPSGMHQGQPGMHQGHPGMPPGQPGFPQGHPGRQQGPPGMQQGPPGMHQGRPGMPPGQSGFPQGHPGWQQGPPGSHQGQPGFPQGHPGWQQSPPGMHQGHPGMPQGQPGVPQRHSGIPQGQTIVPQSQPDPPSGQQPWGGAGKGRGRGQAQKSVSATGVAQTGVPPAQTPQDSPPPPQQQLARMTPPSSSSSVSGKSVASSGNLCRYTIPLKISTRTLRNVRDIRVITNYLPMTITPINVYRYDVTFKPDRPKKMVPAVFTAFKNEFFPKFNLAFDQFKNCYSYKKLPNIDKEERFTKETEITDPNGKKMKFEVSLKATGVVDLTTLLKYMKDGTSLNAPTEAIQCVDVVLRQGTLQSYVKAGRQFFKRPSRPIDLGDGLEMWTGLFQSAIFTSSAYINIDVAHKGFPKHQPLLTAYLNDFRLDPRKTVDRQFGRGKDNFEQFLKGLKVVAVIGGDTGDKGMKREFHVNGLVDAANNLKFTKTDANDKKITMTVADYFLKEKRVKLQYPNLSCVWVGPREKHIYYPMELLTVSYGQAQNKQLNEMQLSTMVKEAATPPDERKRKIEEVIKDMNYSQNPTFKEFGLKIDTKFLEVNARVLQPPVLEVGGRETAMPRRGAWNANKVYKPEPLSAWAFLAIEVDARSNLDYEGMISMFMSCGRQMGMEVSKPQLTDFNVRMNFLHKCLLTALEKNIKFIFIILPTRGKDYYHMVKRMAERDVGILTQCFKEQTAARRMNVQTVKNILLKVNAKLMGINQVLGASSLPRCIKDGGVMVVGADVTHPSPDQSSVPSIAAVTASTDPKCFQYNIALSIQTPKKEVIVQFEEMMVEHLQVYYKRQGSYPRKIYVFRDGVSEGQFAQVMNSELAAVYNAHYRMTNSATKPEVLFLLVQKRHHTRLFSMDRIPQNVEPGTVVDTQIVHAKELDFYLVSHQAIKGTARPTRYHAVCNDGRIPDDEVEQLTYYLCHLYSRCMRSVSYPTPTYYAHLACFRARSLTHGEKFDNQELEKNPKRLRVMEKMLQYSRMFFV